ncbi:tripartite tricarboxylate transporter substrate binding protein [Iocasia frigidifontis]|uniref:Tripartite tricarboxylate transporter substrate binding protein n=1 Tax=Iocasia fonsfrigidae TaxID=2682810 RepID=A0A8A7K810_9FIRM|nr:tripartite tricarboxylate transporter substrate binding protein [Iocasia fonsfrigidae]QTL97330.1 tripartite tricarboxylate transporter substrate binding protein [Iocasia fonsfrigidae]
MKKLTILGILVLFVLVSTCVVMADDYEWQPKKPINLIVPWGAGGSTDRSARVTADIVSDALGVEIIVVNQGGSSGAVGTNNALQAPKDGLTWTAGAVKDLGLYKAQGLLNTTLDDWHIYTNVAMPSVISVSVDSPYEDFGDLLQAFKDNPGKIKVATAGINSAGGTAIAQIKNYTGIKYNHVTYDGGNPAVVSVVSGESDVVPQLSVEQVDMINAGRLRPLAVLSDEPLKIAGYDEPVPSIKKWIPEFVSAPIYFGLFVPKGVPEEVTYTLNTIWENVVMKSEKLEDWAAENAVVYDPVYGAKAVAKSFPMIQLDAYLKYEAGDLIINPVKLGIPRP